MVGVLVPLANHPKRPLAKRDRVSWLPVRNGDAERWRLGRLTLHGLQPEQEPCHPVSLPLGWGRTDVGSISLGVVASGDPFRVAAPMRTVAGKAMGFLGFTPETRAYVVLVAKQVGRDLFSAPRRDFLLGLLVTGVVLVISYFVTGDWDVTTLITFLALVALFLFFAARGFVTVAASRDREHEEQTRSHRETIENLTERIEMARWARIVRQQILGDLLHDLPNRHDAGDVREAVIDAAKRLEQTFNPLPASLILARDRLYELEAHYQKHDEEEKARLIEAVKTLQTSTMADPDI